MIGRTISHYRIVEKLGEGGMGVVYRAEDTKLGRHVAIKFLPPELARDQRAREGFINEARAASSLDHPGICTIHEIGEADGQTFIVMGFIDGESLAGRIAAGPLPVGEAVEIALSAAAALGEAHEKGIVHRDIKPANIMMTAKGEPKIMDFGLATSIERTRLTRTGTTKGTAAYMSPEQARGEQLDRRTDIWSLGAVLYEMLSGRRAFAGDYEQAVLYSIINESPDPLTGLRTGIPVELEQIIGKCLAKDPRMRYQHMDDLIVDLRRLQEQTDTAPAGDPDPRRTGGPRRGVIVAAFVFAIAAIAAVAYLVNERSGGGERETAGPTAGGSWSNSIAVMPFRDLSPGGDQQYLCDGMTDALNAQLSRFEALKVISTTSVMRFRDTELDIKDIGGELGVANVLEGTIQRENDRLRLTAQLISTKTGFHLWSETFDEGIESIFDVQDRITQSIAQALLRKLAPDPQSGLQEKRPVNLEAYEYYMKGMHFIKTRFVLTFQEEDYLKGVEMFERAIEIDSTFSMAYFGLAWAHEHRYQVTLDEKYARLMQKATDRAIELDPNSAISNATKGYTLYEYEKDIDGAFRYLKRALEINANVGEVNFLVGTCYLYLGLYETAIPYLAKAIDLDPYYLWTPYKLAYCYMYTGHLDEAARYFEQYFELAPISLIFPGRYIALNVGNERLDRVESFIAEMETTRPGYHGLPYLKALLLAAQGKRNEALTLHRNSEIYALLGMNDEAIDGLRSEIRGSATFPYCYYFNLLNDPFYRKLHGDPRFDEILRVEHRLYDNLMDRYDRLRPSPE